jgi:hypothetical protein
MGVQETIDLFGYKDDLRLIQSADRADSITEEWTWYAVNKDYGIAVPRDKIKNDTVFRNFVVSFTAMFNKKTQWEKVWNIKYWKVKLGSVYTKNANNQLNKSITIILSFKRILDERTKKNLLIDTDDKQDIFHLLRWMMRNYDTLLRKDNLSLLNKRLRLSEYIITPFVRKMSSSTYRILNSKTVNMNRLKSILKPSPMVIISKLQKSKLLRFNNATNDMDLFNSVLRWSNRGPSALGEGPKKTISTRYRGIHISHMGRLSLNSISNSDPGMTGALSPFVHTNHFYYSDNGEIVESHLKDEEDEED